MPTSRLRLLPFIVAAAILLLLISAAVSANSQQHEDSSSAASKAKTCTDNTSPSSGKTQDQKRSTAFASRPNSRNMPSKEEWPELVGKVGEEAKAEILKDDSRLTVHVIPDGSMVTMDYRLDRVRIFVDEAGKVVRAPRKG